MYSTGLSQPSAKCGLGVVVDPPVLEEDFRLEQGLEELDVQELVAEPSVEGLDPDVLPRGSAA
jgi:hypothetical protein